MSPYAQAKVLRLLESKQAHRLGSGQPVRFDIRVLAATNWNKSQAAQKLHWSRMTLYRKMARYHLTEGGQTPEALATPSRSKL